MSKNLLFSFFPIFLVILLYVFIETQAYALLQSSVAYSNTYNILEACGAILIGFLSDKYCRRKMLLYTQVIGLVLLVLAFKTSFSFPLLLFLGFIYNPLPIVRAGLIDNIPHYSKVKLISFTFVFQFLPWCIYDKIINFKTEDAYLSTILCIAVSLLVSLFFFFDQRDSKVASINQLQIYKLIHPSAKKKFFYTLFAFLPVQLVYFFSDNLLESYSQNPQFYSIISFGSVIGALISSLYKKTPHVSVLTISYGINMLLSIIPIACLYIYNFHDISVPLQLMIFSSLSGFSLPFVYDIMLNAIDAHFRGTTCGILDWIYSISSVFNIVLVGFLSVNLFFTFAIITFFFALATLLQKKAENA